MVKRHRRGRGCTAEQWRAMLEFYEHTCLSCGFQGKLTADHVNPVKDGGRDHVSNIQPLCGPCNSSKGASFEDHRDLMKHLELMDKMATEGILKAL